MMDWRRMPMMLGVTGLGLVLTGCLGDAAKPSVTSLREAADQLQSTIDNSSKDATKLRRLNYAYRLALGGAGTTAKTFPDFACQGAGAYGRQRFALGGIRQLGTTVDTLTAPADSDLGKVLASIAKYRAKVDPLPEQRGANVEAESFDKCRTQTQADLAALLKPQEDKAEARSLAAIGGAVTALQALAAAVEKLVLLAAQQADVALRAKRFKEFMNEPQTLKSLQDILGPCVVPRNEAMDITKVEPKDYAEFTKKCFADNPRPNSTAALSDANMKSIIDERRRLSLLVPYNAYIAINSGATGANGSRSQYLASIEKVDASLATFDSIREVKIAKDQQLQMATAVNDLWRISQGRLTSGEELAELWATAQMLVALFQNASEDIGGIEDKWKAVVDALKKL